MDEMSERLPKTRERPEKTLKRKPASGSSHRKIT